jgi:PKD repeat protein
VNRAPAAVLTADNLTGMAPLNLTITVDGSDPDGDELTWTLDLGDGGEALTGDEFPFTVNHTFTEAGNYTLNLTVSDGTLSDTVALNITVEADLGEIPDPYSNSNTLIVATPFPPVPGHENVGPYCAPAGVNSRFLGPIGGRDGHIFSVAGDPSVFSLRWFSGSSNPQNAWLINHIQNPGTSPFLRYDETAETGLVPEGANWVEICLKSGQNTQYTLRIHHPSHPDAPAL